MTGLLLFQELLAPDSIGLGIDFIGKKAKKWLKTDLEALFLTYLDANLTPNPNGYEREKLCFI